MYKRQSQTFFTSGVPLALFNFFGQLVWIVFVWKGYESKANSFSIVALGPVSYTHLTFEELRASLSCWLSMEARAVS